MGLSVLSPKIYGVLDVGTSAVRAVIATPHDHKWTILGWGAYPSSGIKKGQIIDAARLYRCVQCTWEQALLQAGLSSVNAMSMNIGDPSLAFSLNHYTMSLRKGRVSKSDLQELKKRPIHELESDQKKILHTLSLGYKIDDRELVSSPIGLNGEMIEWDVLNVLTTASTFQAKAQILSQLSIELSYPVVDMLAASKAILTPDECEQGVLMIDLGAGSTKGIFYKNGVVRMMKILPIGGDQITSDIALALKTSVATAEVLKVRHGSVAPPDFDASRLQAHLTSSQKSMILDQQALNCVNHVMTIRLEEILTLMGSEMNGLMTPKKVVLTGGPAQTQGLIALAERILEVPARIGMPQGFSDQPPFFHSPAAATVIGLLAWSREQDLSHSVSALSGWKKIFSKLQDWITK